MALENEQNITFVFTRTFEEIKDFPLLNDGFTFLTYTVVAYLFIVLKIGPEYMKNREPFKLKNTILVYNAFQVILSAYMVYIALDFMLKYGLLPERCHEDDPQKRIEMYSIAQIYIWSKVTELADTIFFVLRKKDNQVSFLHVYHHSTVIFGSFMMANYALGQTAVWTTFINSLVHVVMYFYYFMAAMGPKYQKYLTWKKYITTFQLTQFVSIVLQQIPTLLLTKCQHSTIGLIYASISSMIFYGLFNNFYINSYNQTKKAPANGTLKETEEKAKEQ